MTCDSDMAKSISEEVMVLTIMCQEVDDVIDECESNTRPEDTKDAVMKLEEVRRSIRMSSMKLTASGAAFPAELDTTINHTLTTIKDFIKNSIQGCKTKP